MLEYHAHLLPVQVDVHRLIRQVYTVKKDLTAGGLLQQIQGAQQGGLAGPRGADDGHHFPLCNVQATVVQRLHGAMVVLLHQVLHGDQLIACRHDASSFQWLRWPWRPGS